MALRISGELPVAGGSWDLQKVRKQHSEIAN